MLGSRYFLHLPGVYSEKKVSVTSGEHLLVASCIASVKNHQDTSIEITTNVIISILLWETFLGDDFLV